MRLGIERAPAGSVLHAVAEEGVAMREIAEAIGAGPRHPHGLDQRRSRPASTSASSRRSSRMDMPVSSAITRELLDWTPSGPGLVEDIAAGHYFEERALKY